MRRACGIPDKFWDSAKWNLGVSKEVEGVQTGLYATKIALVDIEIFRHVKLGHIATFQES